MRSLSRLSLNQKLGALALALGALAVFANVTPGHTVTLNAKELLTGVARQEDHVSPAELAGWIIEAQRIGVLVLTLSDLGLTPESATPRRARKTKRTAPSVSVAAHP